MLKSMGGNCINIGVVLERYADFCGQLRRDADPRLKELLAGQLVHARIGAAHETQAPTRSADDARQYA
jgi:hypothetical protein